MNSINGRVKEIISSRLQAIVKEIKHLTSLPNDAECLRHEIDRVKGIVDHINSALSWKGPAFGSGKALGDYARANR
ncbi:hypothetical protein SUGI_0384880 [Cryptomeria japonica]|nr:hypothetical protein SUGI_0384880 [Cryptomeria japonica]